MTLANSVQELMFLEEDTDELDVFTDFQNFLPPDQAVRDTILLELQRTLSLRVQGPVSKEMRRLKKWGQSAPERLQHLHRKYYKAVDSGAAATRRLEALSLIAAGSVDALQDIVETAVDGRRYRPRSRGAAASETQGPH